MNDNTARVLALVSIALAVVISFITAMALGQHEAEHERCSCCCSAPEVKQIDLSQIPVYPDDLKYACTKVGCCR